MTAQIVTTEELIGYLADIVEKHGDIPAGVVGGSQAYDYARRQDTQTKAAPIN